LVEETAETAEFREPKAAEPESPAAMGAPLCRATKNPEFSGRPRRAARSPTNPPPDAPRKDNFFATAEHR
jgi:hypothetical protein